MLDELIRAALSDAADECVVPDAVDQAVRSRILQGDSTARRPYGGASDEK